MSIFKLIILTYVIYNDLMIKANGQNDHEDEHGERKRLKKYSIMLNPNSNCIFIGCSCNLSLIKCPSDYKSELLDNNKLSMFPKRINHYLDNSSTASIFSILRSKENNLTLVLKDNYLEMIPDDRFSGLSFYKIDLSNNLIFKLSPFIFRDIIRLEVLDLTNNKIRHLNSNIFSPVESCLRVLKLNHNYLNEFETLRLTNAFARLFSLRELDMSNNKLLNLPNLSKLSLSRLILKSNEIESLVDPDTSKQLLPIHLVELNLEDNLLKHINDDYFANLKSLKYLNLANNQISAIAEDSFSSLINLLEIDLSKNNLKHIPSRIIYTLINLEYLDLSTQNQNIRTISDYAFDRENNLKPIKRINLKNNKISKIENRAFCSRSYQKQYANIKELDLSNNLLEYVDACILRQLAKGLNININGTNRTQKVLFKTSTLRASNETIKLIKCDCEVTKANKMLDLDGTCRRYDNFTLTAKNYDCGDSLSTNVKYIYKYCSSLEQYECVLSIDHSSKVYNLKDTQTTATKSSITFPHSNLSQNFTKIYFNSNRTMNLSNISNWELNDNDEFDEFDSLNSTLFKTNFNETSKSSSSSFTYLFSSLSSFFLLLTSYLFFAVFIYFNNQVSLI